MKRRYDKKLNSNKGYTLVELIIVIAITLVLAAMSFVTLGILNTARGNAAAVAFDTDLHSMWKETKAKASDTATLLTYDATEGCWTTKTNLLTGGTYSASFLTNAELMTKYNKNVTIEYTPENAACVAPGTDDQHIIIQYNKSDGTVKYGAGKYDFYLMRGSTKGRLLTSVTLNKDSGNHSLTSSLNN